MRFTLIPGLTDSVRRPRGAREKMPDVTAILLDGKATLATIKSELRARVAALADRGDRARARHGPDRRRPRLAVVCRRQTQDCASIGINSIRRDLPASATQAEAEAVVDELNADPACTGFLVQQPTGLDEFALLSRVSPDKDVDGLHPVNLGKLVLGESRPLPCTPIGIIELLRRYDVNLTAPRWSWSVAG